MRCVCLRIGQACDTQADLIESHDAAPQLMFTVAPWLVTISVEEFANASVINSQLEYVS